MTGGPTEEVPAHPGSPARPALATRGALHFTNAGKYTGREARKEVLVGEVLQMIEGILMAREVRGGVSIGGVLKKIEISTGGLVPVEVVKKFTIWIGARRERVIDCVWLKVRTYV